MKLVIDARESGTSTGRYVDKLIEYLAPLKPDLAIEILTKSSRIDALKKLAPNFTVTASDFKEFTFAEQLGLKRQLRALKADLVHFSMTQQPVSYRGKKLTTIHDLTTARFRNPSKNRLIFGFKQMVYKAVIKRAAHTSAAIITPSKYVKEDLVSFSGIKPAKVNVIYEAADKITEIAKPLENLKSGGFLMYVGRPTPHKNLARLVAAFEILLQERPDLKLVLAGKTDANYEKLKQFVADKNLTSQVIFSGFVSEGQLRWLYENCQAYVFPSLSEGFGLPGLEAMAHGAPIVSSSATALPEIYGDAAIYFDPIDERDIAAKIAQVLDDSKLRQDLISKGLRQAQKYSWAVAAEQTLKLYKALLED